MPFLAFRFSPRTSGSYCCAQFAVSRARIKGNPLERPLGQPGEGWIGKPVGDWRWRLGEGVENGRDVGYILLCWKWCPTKRAYIILHPVSKPLLQVSSGVVKLLARYQRMQQMLFSESPEVCHDIPGHPTLCLMFEVLLSGGLDLESLGGDGEVSSVAHGFTVI